MPEALAAVKRALGPDAVILGARTLSGGVLGRSKVEITAAHADADTPAPRLRAQPLRRSALDASTSSVANQLGGSTAPSQRGRARVTLPDALAGDQTAMRLPGAAPTPRRFTPPTVEDQEMKAYYTRLVQQQVGESVAQEILGEARRRGGPLGHAVREALRDFIAQSVPLSGELTLPAGAKRRVAFVGPPGAGKTTTIAKLAALHALRHRRRVGLLSLDLQRLGAHEHLQHFARVISTPLRSAQAKIDVQPALKELDDPELLLIDTPGLGLRESASVMRLGSLLRACKPDEVHLVAPASLRPEIYPRLAEVFAPLQPTRLVLTHLDDVVGAGVVLEAAQRVGCGLSYLSAGQRVPNDLEAVSDHRLAEVICGNVL